MKVYYDKDCDLSLIKGKTVAIIGYGSQGHAHAQNLNDSGVKVVVGLRKGGASWDKVGKAGLNVMEVNDAVKLADVVMILLPDEQISEVYNNNVAPHMKQGASLAFAHGFNVHYNQVVPRADLDVWMVAPKAPGHTVRSTYTQGGGVPHLVASSKPISAKKPKPICSASKLCCAVARLNSSKWVMRLWLRLGMPLKWRISNVCTNSN